MAVAALLATFIILWESPPEAFLRDRGDSDKSGPSARAYLTGVSTQQYDEQGRLAYSFTADRVSHFQMHPKRRSARDYTELEKPRLIMFRGNEDPWHLSAIKGVSQGKTITLRGEVRIWREDQSGERAELSTSELVVTPEQQYAQTDKPVTISAPGSLTEAGGMKLNIKQDRWVLTSRVKGKYEPYRQ